MICQTKHIYREHIFTPSLSLESIHVQSLYRKVPEYQINKSPKSYVWYLSAWQNLVVSPFHISHHSKYVHSGLTLRWRHNGPDIVSNHQPHYCLLNRLFRRRSKETSKLRVTGLCAGNSPGTGEFSAQMASYAENVYIWWRHHGAPTFGRSRGFSEVFVAALIQF